MVFCNDWEHEDHIGWAEVDTKNCTSEDWEKRWHKHIVSRVLLKGNIYIILIQYIKKIYLALKLIFL